MTSSRLPIGVAQTASGTAYSPSSASKPIIAAPITPASHAELRLDDPDRVTARLEPFARDDLAGRVEQELAGRAEAAAHDDELGLEDVDEGRDPGAELPPDPAKRIDRCRVAVARP